MGDDRYQFKLLVEHSETGDNFHGWCDLGAITEGIVGLWRREYYGDEPYEIVGDALGRPNNGNWHRWRLLVCNNPSCKGRARYRADLVEQTANEWDERRKEQRRKGEG